MIARKLKRLKMVLSDSRWWGFYVQRRFMSPRTRNWLADRMARRRPAGTATDAAAAAAAQALRQDGIFMLGELFTPAQCQELRSYFEGLDAHDPYRPGSPRFKPLGEGRHPEAHIAHHDAEDILNAPYLLQLANDPRIIAAVTAFLGCKPSIGYLAAWWSYHTALGAQQAEFFHRDVDDWRFVKLFVYLTDVGADSGPHVYVRASSNDERLAEIRRFPDEEVARVFGEQAIMTMTAQAGQGFLEDTFGIHKGQPVAQGTRLIFQAVYGLSPLPYGPREPVPSSRVRLPPGLDRWTNRFYVA